MHMYHYWFGLTLHKVCASHGDNSRTYQRKQAVGASVKVSKEAFCAISPHATQSLARKGTSRLAR